MITINKDKESIDDIRIRELLQKNDFLHDRNNEISNRIYKKKYEMTMNLHIRKDVLVNSTIN